MEYFISVTAIVFAVETLIKLVCTILDKKEVKKRKEAIEDLKLICSEISYNEYVKIAKKASVRNAPMRLKGDFWDFILPFANCPNSGYLETRLAKADCEETNYE